MNIFLSFVGTAFLSCAEVYLWFVLADKKIDYKEKKMYLYTLILTICVFINHNYGIHSIKEITTVLFALIFCKIIVKLSIRETVILTFLGQLIIMITEAIMVGIMSVVFRFNIDYIMNDSLVTLFFDLVMTVLVILFSRIKIWKKLYNWIIRITGYIKTSQLAIFLLFITLGSSIFSTSVYFKNNLIISLIFNVAISIIYTVIIILVFRYQYKYYVTKSKYSLSLDDLQAQETLLNDYRISNHENKNNLLTIKEMTSNKKILGFINALIKENYSSNNYSLVKKCMKLPTRGIRALIYNKMKLMNSKGIKCYLSVDRKVSSEIIKGLTDDDIVDICKILGVFLDNSIEELDIYEKKIINISLSLFDKSLSIVISNNYNGPVNKNNLDSKKSTKGKGRGYGLQLVKRIVSINKKIDHNTIIGKDLFTQEIIVKL